jgi:hypothetical protein
MKQDLDAGAIARRGRAKPADLVFDFAGKRSPDLGAICLMLTARNLAGDENRKVWLHALPEPTWRLLHSLGLQRYFELLPASGKVMN